MTVVVIGDNTGDDYSGTDDTKLRSSAATTNYGTDGEISISSSYFGQVNVSLLRFSGISNITGPVTVSTATTSLYETQFQGTSPMAANVHRIKRAWVESEATYNIYSTSNNWETAGAAGANDIDTTPIASPSLTNTSGYQDITGLAADFEDWINGTYTNDGHKLAGNEADDQWYFRTSEGTDGQRPYVTIDYSAAAAAASSNLLLMGVG